MSVEVLLCSKRFLLYLKRCYCIQNTFSLFESFRPNICTILHALKIDVFYTAISSIERRSKVFTKTYNAKNAAAIGHILVSNEFRTRVEYDGCIMLFNITMNHITLGGCSGYPLEARMTHAAEESFHFTISAVNVPVAQAIII